MTVLSGDFQAGGRKRKRIRVTLAACISAVSLHVFGAVDKPRDAARDSAGSPASEIVLPVHGMMCAACVAKVRKGLTRTRGVAAVNVDLAARNARISYDPQRVSAKQLAAVVDKLGFKAGEPRPVEGDGRGN
jgi:copper chaperone CopZ